MMLPCLDNANKKYIDNLLFSDIHIFRKGTKGLKKGPFWQKRDLFFLKKSLLLKGLNAPEGSKML